MSERTPIERPALVARFGNRRFEIVPDLPEVGVYLLVHEGGACIADHLQDSVEIRVRQAFNEFGVPIDAWRPPDEAA